MIVVTEDQRSIVKFYPKNVESEIETLNLLQQAFDNEFLSRSRVFDWLKRFEDDLRWGRPAKSKSDKIV